MGAVDTNESFCSTAKSCPVAVAVSTVTLKPLKKAFELAMIYFVGFLDVSFQILASKFGKRVRHV